MVNSTAEGADAAKSARLAQRRSGPAAKAAYRDLFLRSMDSILLVSTETAEIIEANEASSNIFGLSLEQIEGSPVYDYCHPDCLGEFRKMLRIAARRYHPRTFEIKLQVGEPRRLIISEVAASPLQLQDETEVLQLIVRDITEQKEAERKIADYIQQIEEANKKLEELAITDGMTGLVNFREFIRLLEAEHQLAARYHSAYAIIFTDVDNFKEYNDRHGHPAGDELLKAYAKILKSSVRGTDTAVRYGGEEFVILCPHTDVDSACVVAERIRSELAAADISHADEQPLGCASVSIGVTAYPENGGVWQAVLNEADKALYKAKKAGRNRIMRGPRRKGSDTSEAKIHLIKPPKDKE